jgi:dienelactone hydrolase
MKLWRFSKAIGATLAVIALGTSGLFLFLFPIPAPPHLAGPHAIGTRTFEIPASEGKSRLLYQIWYPTDQPNSGKPTPWLPDPELAPKFPFHRIRNATARAKTDAPPLEGNHAGLPVVFYEHSWTGHRGENIAQVESLASMGFVIIALDHPGQAARVRYADGSVAKSNLADPPDLTTAASVAAFEADAERCLRERGSNVSRVVRSLAKDALRDSCGRLDLSRIGVFGFSFGGTSAIRLCARDPAFVAGANEDGLYLGDEMPRGPFLFFDQEMPKWLLEPAGQEEDAGQALTRRAESRIQQALNAPGRFRQILDRTNHASFTDRLFLSRFPRLAGAGERPAEEVHSILVARLGEFFKNELKSGKHPEQRIE